jgi:flagellar biogenesis protein FliO
VKNLFRLPPGTLRTAAFVVVVCAVVGLAAYARPAPARSSVSPTPDAQAQPTPWLRSYNELPGNAWESAPADEGWGADLYVKFGIVIVVLFLALQGLKRLSQGQRLPGGLGGSINVMETAYLAPNRALHLVQVGSRLVLLGATPTSITYLTALEAEAISVTTAVAISPAAADHPGDARAGNQRPSFGETLSSLTSQTSPGTPDQASAGLDQIRQRMARIRDSFTHDAGN